MGFLDDAKDKLNEAKEKIEDLIGGHEDQADQAIDKTADVVDDKTGGDHSAQIDAAADKAHDAVDALDGDDAPPAAAPPAAAPPAAPTA
jgi:ABC-type transporter Mla subunit MlaD